MKLVNVENKDIFVTAYLPRRSLYIMKYVVFNIVQRMKYGNENIATFAEIVQDTNSITKFWTIVFRRSVERK